MRSIKRIATNALLGLALASTAGCYAGGGYGGSDEYDEYYGYDAPPAYYYDDSYAGHYHHGHGYYRDHYGHGYYRDHRGYHREARRPRVPRDADAVANGPGGLAYTPDRPGRVYVRDEKTGKVVYSGRVKPGQDVRVSADAKGGRVSVDGRTARGGLSRRPREREVYFRPDRGSAGDRRGNEERREKSGDDRPRERGEQRGESRKSKEKD